MAFLRQALAITLLSAAACAHSTSTGAKSPAPPQPIILVGGAVQSTAAPSPDPRIGLRAGLMDAGEATWNLRVVSKTPPSK